jgi:hypothetical protein
VKFDKPEFFPYRHAIDLTIGLTHGIPLQTDSHEKAHTCSGALFLKIEQTSLALSHSPLGFREQECSLSGHAQEKHFRARFSHGVFE